ncbi:hypothetical protein [Halorussus halophilus]|uniref:hypothetical protein n=1 Tax=Halorussus halophilus TaxID=2650975 RepID=UPI0013016082|nr:hypothetical protein [Halorussus halophilus]
MKTNNPRKAAPPVRAPYGRTLPNLARRAVPVVGALTLVAAALAAGLLLATALALLPNTVPTILLGWVASIGLAFALPVLVVKAVVAGIERAQ